MGEYYWIQIDFYTHDCGLVFYSSITKLKQKSDKFEVRFDYLCDGKFQLRIYRNKAFKLQSISLPYMPADAGIITLYPTMIYEE